ncbi:MAG TPA: hypothetical protein VMW15_14085 [Terracidiphilus sp.]|nr:hypothetical protein [Terracidiphilus sp.]
MLRLAGFIKNGASRLAEPTTRLPAGPIKLRYTNNLAGAKDRADQSFLVREQIPPLTSTSALQHVAFKKLG